MGKRRLESPLDSNEIKPISPAGNQPLMFTGKTDAKVEAPIFWLPLEKTLMLGKTESKRRRGQQKKRWLDDIIDSMDTSLSKLR